MHSNICLEQIDAIIGLPGPKRYEHFIKVCADRRQMWGLYSNGWALAATSENQPVFPVWPAREYASLCAVKEWDGYVPREIELDDFFLALLPRLEASGTQIGVFYTPQEKGVIPTLAQLDSDLKEELAKIE